MSEEIKAIFSGIDKEGTGAINKAQFSEFLASKAEHKEKAQTIADATFEKIGSETINLEQFGNVIKHLKENPPK